jgi:hypothetical protein
MTHVFGDYISGTVSVAPDAATLELINTTIAQSKELAEDTNILLGKVETQLAIITDNEITTEDINVT